LDVVARVGKGRDGIPVGMLDMNCRNPKVSATEVWELAPAVGVRTALSSRALIKLRNRLRGIGSPVVVYEIEGERVDMELI
jgi:hypothetical protein